MQWFDECKVPASPPSHFVAEVRPDPLTSCRVLRHIVKPDNRPTNR